MTALFDRVNMVWDYFKRGNSELRNFYGIRTFVITLSLKFNIDLTRNLLIIWTIIFVPFCIALGRFFRKKVNIAANKTNPYTQDSILSAMNLQQSLLYLYEYEETKDDDYLNLAKDEMKKALHLIVGDGKYGNHHFLGALKDELCGALVRLRRDRVLYGPPGAYGCR